VGQLGQPKVEYFRLTLVRHEDIGGLDVTLHDSLGVGCPQSSSNLNGEVKQQINL
jgi:hypothetical protein